MSDPSERDEPPHPPSSEVDLEVDLGAFLPEGSTLDPSTADVAVLARIEHELVAVDEALEAIDAGDLGRSALLVELVGNDVAARADS